MGESIVSRIVALKRLCSLQEEQIRSRFNLSSAEYAALCVLDDNVAVSCKELAGRMYLSPSRGSRVIARLVAAGYVREFDGSADRRVHHLELTPQGVQIRQCIAEQKALCEQSIIAGCSAAELAQLKKSLDLLVGLLSKRESAHGA